MAKKKADEKKEPSEAVAKWFKEIDAARRREKDFRDDGARILKLYDGTKAAETPFNILYSNTETLLPAVYSAIPRPVVQRRFKDEDPLGKSAATAGQRMLEFLIDTNVDGYETFDDGMGAATLDALLPGRASTAVVYDAEMENAEPTEDEPVEGETPPPAPIPYAASELVCLNTKTWDRVYFGYAKKWSEMPWVAYEEDVDKPEAERLFTKTIADKMVFSKGEAVRVDGKKQKGEDQNQGERETCRIYQIWDKDGGKKVRYISEAYPDDYLKEEDDPLGLTGFFNCPKPLQFLKKSSTLLPTALYILYESQAKELNELTRRIKNVTKAIKAKGIYDSELGDDLGKLMAADDNELVPSDKSASLAAEKGIDKAIWFMPIEQLIATLVQLYGAREQCKQVIYEITGISDIIRGASKASETLGAQEIKTQWGTLRLKRLQKEVARYARDLLRMMLEIAATKFSETTWAKMTGLPFLVSAKYNELTTLAQKLQQVVQQQPPAPQAMPGQPPQPAPPNPMQQQLQQVMEQLKTPQWSQVLAMLKDDLQRAYRIDIETNSTVEPEAAEDQKNIQDVMTALGQVLNGIGPLVAKGVLPFEAAQVMLLTIIRRFRFGAELEDTIKAMQPPKPEDDGKGAELAKLQQQAAQQQMQSQQKEASHQIKEQQTQAEQSLKEKDTQLSLREQKLAQAEEMLALSQQVAQEQLAMKTQALQAKTGPEAAAQEQRVIQAERETERMKAQIHQNTEIRTAEIAAAAQIECARIAAQAVKDKPEPEAVAA